MYSSLFTNSFQKQKLQARILSLPFRVPIIREDNDVRKWNFSLLVKLVPFPLKTYDGRTISSNPASPLVFIPLIRLHSLCRATSAEMKQSSRNFCKM